MEVKDYLKSMIEKYNEIIELSKEDKTIKWAMAQSVKYL